MEEDEWGGPECHCEMQHKAFNFLYGDRRIKSKVTLGFGCRTAEDITVETPNADLSQAVGFFLCFLFFLLYSA